MPGPSPDDTNAVQSRKQGTSNILRVIQEVSQRELEELQRMLDSAQRTQNIVREEHGRERSR